MKDWQFSTIIALLCAILATQMKDPFPFGLPLLIIAFVYVVMAVIDYVEEKKQC